jgi:PKD repeat protein
MTKKLLSGSVLAALLAAGACTVHQTEAPSLSGPSTFARSVTVTATPDYITQDGASQSSVSAQVIGPDGRPLGGISLRMDMLVDGQANDYGTLSARTVVTGSDGMARVVYTAPPAPPPPADTTFSTVGIRAITIGSDAQADNGVITEIRLVPAGVILPPAGTPTAAFAMSPAQALMNVPVTLDASSSLPGAGASSITTYSWNFGDGTAAGTGKSVTHTFTTQQTFNVTLTVTNDRGLSASTTKPTTVGGLAAPVALFVFSPTAPAAGQTVIFNAEQSTAAPGHSLSAVNWTFGDGATASGSIVSHAFTAAGSYNVVLSVTDDTGQKGTLAQSVTVTAGGGSSGSTTAKFTFSPATPNAGQSVFFNASTSTASTGHTLTTYAWDFGDGTTGTGVSITHVFTAAGTFTVTLTVTDDIGQKGTIATPVTIATTGSGSLTADFSKSPTNPVSGQQVSFNANLSSPIASITSYDWDFGDGTVVNGQTSFLINHTYFTVTGNIFTIRLTVHDNTGRVATKADTLTVTAIATDPIARFTVDPSPTTVGTVVTFDGAASNAYPGDAGPPVIPAKTLVRYEWNFGDGSAIVSTFLADTDTTHSYAATGTYTIRLTVFDSSGASASTTRTLLVQ